MDNLIKLLEKAGTVKLYLNHEGKYYVEVYKPREGYEPSFFYVTGMSLEGCLMDALQRVTHQ